jgi:putative ABC transport system permease protein
VSLAIFATVGSVPNLILVSSCRTINNLSPFTSLAVRTAAKPLALVSAIRQQIRQVDADQGVAKVEAMTQMVAGSVARPRVDAFLLTMFGIIARALACIGLYGVVAYSVAQRFRKIEIRLALGASGLSVFRAVLAEGFRLTLMGLLSGLAVALLLTRYVRSLLFEIQPSDPLTLCAVTGIILVVSLLACCWPAYRAMTVDPVLMLREE